MRKLTPYYPSFSPVKSYRAKAVSIYACKPRQPQ